MSDASKAMVENAKAAYRRINQQLRAGNLSAALALFKVIPKEFDSLQELAFNRPITAVHLVFECLKAGNLTQARQLFEAMAQLGNAPEMVLLRTEVAHNLMIDYIRAGNLSEARALLEAMAQLGDAPETAALRDEATHNLIIGYLCAGNFLEAQKLFASMAVPDSRQKPRERWGEYSRSFISTFQKNQLFKT